MLNKQVSQILFDQPPLILKRNSWEVSLKENQKIIFLLPLFLHLGKFSIKGALL